MKYSIKLDKPLSNVSIPIFIFPFNNNNKLITVDTKIDTGSNLTIISGELLSSKLKSESLQHSSKYVAISATGDKLTLYELYASVLIIGQEGFRNQKLYINFDWKGARHNKALLGMDLWGYFEAYFSYKDKKLYYELSQQAIKDIGYDNVLTQKEVDDLTIGNTFNSDISTNPYKTWEF